jgi:hypothetical protein
MAEGTSFQMIVELPDGAIYPPTWAKWFPEGGIAVPGERAGVVSSFCSRSRVSLASQPATFERLLSSVEIEDQI